MSADKPKFETIEPGHPISMLSNALSDNAMGFAGRLGISRMDVAVALANAAGQILGDSKDMPRDVAVGRMDDLRRVMEAAYDLRKIDGSA